MTERSRETIGRVLAPGSQISHYRVVRSLGAGGMGEVYLAQDLTLERSVALKILPPALVRNEERLRRFIFEAKSASSLNHPNIVTIYEIGQDEVRLGDDSGGGDAVSAPVHFISMERVDGRTLTDKIHSEREDLRTLLGYLAQVAEGLAKAHAAGIVHRDLKPGNIIFLLGRPGAEFRHLLLPCEDSLLGRSLTSCSSSSWRRGESMGSMPSLSFRDESETRAQLRG